MRRGKLRIVSAGAGATIQDAGRFGYLRYGIVASGPMDWVAYEVVNRALENPERAACIEVPPHGIEVACEDAPLRVAFAGGGFSWQHGTARIGTSGVLRLRPGERLSAKTGTWGTWAYLAVAGGIDVKPVLGSRSTYARFGLEGIEGRTLRAGDVLETFAADNGDDGAGTIACALVERPHAPIRVMLGPQDDYLTADSIDAFFSQAYAVSTKFDRMGYWIDGPKLQHAHGFDIVSDGIALGAIQVPGTGQPLVLMADHQSTGGYPKLGTVVRADIGALAQHRPGEQLHFARCDAETARRALLEIYVTLETEIFIVPRGQIREEDLHASNLISGVVDGSSW